MSTFLSEQAIFPIAAVPQATFTANATTDLLTSNGHGLSTGDSVLLTTQTTLPAPLALLTIYYVVNPTTNTFQLSATKNGSAINLTDAGTGTHTFTIIGKQILVKGLQNVELGVYTSNSFNATIKVQISDQSDVVFSSTASATNRWSYAQIKDLITDASTDGGSGITSSGTDLTKTYEVNTNGQYWISAQFTAYSAGNINLLVTCINPF